jgi:hypothetical protein
LSAKFCVFKDFIYLFDLVYLLCYIEDRLSLKRVMRNLNATILTEGSNMTRAAAQVLSQLTLGVTLLALSWDHQSTWNLHDR